MERNSSQELLAQKERAERYLNIAGCIIMVLDPNGKINLLNAKGYQILEYEPEELLGEDWVNTCLPPEIREELKVVFEESMKGGVSLVESYENPIITKTGKKRMIKWTNTLLEDENGKITGILSSGEDVTERNEMEERVSQERNMLEAVTQNIGAGLVIINKDYRILWANKFLTELNGEVENKICYLTFSKQNLICADCGVKKVFEGTASDSREYFNEMLHSKGLPCWFELIATPIKDKEGNVIAALELTVDITEKKFLQNKLAKHSERLEEEVEERTDQLRQTQVKLVKSERLAAIGELAGMIGHDLRNPLTGIKNAAYFLKRKGLTIPESDHAAMLEIIEKGVTHSDKIISDLIDYAKDLHLYLQTCEIQKVLREALAKVPIPDKIEIINNIPKELVIKVDEDSMERVFVNLTKNSIEAMPEGGTITLDCSTTENTVEISFSDTGIGINEEAMPKLFFPLLTTKAQGMGFGLANCRRIIEAHGGTISVKSAKGKGTIFLISLPFRNTLENERGKIWINIPGSSSLASKMQEL